MFYIDFICFYKLEEFRLVGSRVCSFVSYLVLTTELSVLYGIWYGGCLKTFLVSVNLMKVVSYLETEVIISDFP
jgi:hypothetical protein